MSGWRERLAARAKRLKTDVPAVFLAMKHAQTPWYAKALAFATVAYALSPIDLIPDFIPVLGFLDDVLLLPLLVALTLKCVPQEVMGECRERAEGLWANGKPVKWWYALPIAGVWLLVLWLILKACGAV